MAGNRTQPPPWWVNVCSRASRRPAERRVPLRLAGQELGSVAAVLLKAMVRAGLAIDAEGRLSGEPDATLAGIARWLREAGHAGAWRDEALAVRTAPGKPPLAVVERGVARQLGIHTEAVQLHARCAESGRWWLQQRALDKATDPGLWDTVVGGMVSAGESVAQALEREAWEEAGLRCAALAPPPALAGCFTVRRPLADSGSHGWQVETVHAYACSLPAGLLPHNQDGEVLRFEAVDGATLDAWIAAGRLTLEASIAVALCRAADFTA